MTIDADALYKKICTGPIKYKEEVHCPMILRIMADENKGRVSAFCVEAGVTDRTMQNWVRDYELFAQSYALGKLIARENWEKQGEELKDRSMPLGMIDHSFEHWKMIGWSRFGVSKNPRVKLNLNPDDTPDKHYSQLLRQASDGDFTAGEIKQLMESINVGLNTHQVFQLQKEIDQLKSDLSVMTTNSNGNHPVSNKGTT